eukprot:scaffold29670_cov45-Phaeocystis_antarctica.AAC.2
MQPSRNSSRTSAALPPLPLVSRWPASCDARRALPPLPPTASPSPPSPPLPPLPPVLARTASEAGALTIMAPTCRHSG